MIVFDTETSGLIKSMELPLEQQPEITELAVVRLDDELNEVDAFETLVKPRMQVGEETIAITGITNEMLADAPSFARVLPRVERFFLGESTLVGQNISFDVGMLTLELRRLDRVTRFPWPPEQIDTVELLRDVTVKRKQSEVVKKVKGRGPDVVHRAMADVRELCDILRWLRGLDGRI